MVDCTGTAPRYGTVIRAQQSLADARTSQRAIISDVDQNLGIYGAIMTSDVLLEG